jgi:hypothetical protein
VAIPGGGRVVSEDVIKSKYGVKKIREKRKKKMREVEWKCVEEIEKNTVFCEGVKILLFCFLMGSGIRSYKLLDVFTELKITALRNGYKKLHLKVSIRHVTN